MPALTAPPINQAVRDSEWFALKETAREQGYRTFTDESRGAEGFSLLLPYQSELFVQLAQHDVLVVEKGRRTGFTWGVASKAVLTAAAAKSARGMNVFYMGYNREMAREFIDVCGMWARNFGPVATVNYEYLFEYEDERGERQAIKSFSIDFASGFHIVALPSKPRSLRGMQGLVIIDEAAFHEDLEAVATAALALLMWGGIVVFISTHNGEDNYFNTLVREAREREKPYGFMRVDFGRALKEGLYQRICLVTGKPWSAENEKAWRVSIEAKYGAGASEELYCEPRADSTVDVFIPRQGVDEAMRRAVPENNGHPLVLGCDVARFGDDSSVIYPRRGRDARSLETLVFHGLSTVEFARQIVLTAMRLNADWCFVDETGVGGGVVDALNDLFHFEFFDGVTFSSAAQDKRYANRRAEMYAGLREWVGTGCLPSDRELAQEITAAKYEYRGDQILLEAKADIKKRLGKSPDRPDALALTFAGPVPHKMELYRMPGPVAQDVRDRQHRDVRRIH